MIAVVALVAALAADVPPAVVPPAAAVVSDDERGAGKGAVDASDEEHADGAEDAREAKLSLRFADHLFGDGDYYRAISEYRRFLFMTKGAAPEAPRAAMAIGEALLRGEQFDAAGRQLDGVATRTPDLVLRRSALFGAARAYLEDGRPELAKPRFRLIVEDPEADRALVGQSRWLLAWGHFDAGELEKARDLFATIAASDSPYAKDAQGVVDSIDKKGELDTKDPLLAALFSIIPGGGQAYLGQWGTAATSLVWNSLFIFAAVSAWLSGDWGVAVVLTFAELGWYSGSMFGAIAGTFRHNRDVTLNWRDETIANFGKSRALPELPTLVDQPPGTLLRFSGTF